MIEKNKINYKFLTMPVTLFMLQKLYHRSEEITLSKITRSLKISYTYAWLVSTYMSKKGWVKKTKRGRDVYLVLLKEGETVAKAVDDLFLVMGINDRSRHNFQRLMRREVE